MKVYIMVDFEGVAGMIEWDNYYSDTAGSVEKRRRYRKILTDEVNAAIDGVIAAGAEEILVWDSHGPSNNCHNLIIENVHPEAWVILGWKGLPEFYPLLEDSFDAGIYIGGHAMEGTPFAILPHTVTTVNGIKYGEVGMFVAMCGWHGIPMAFISGDKAVVEETKQLIPEVYHVVTKEAFGPYAAKTRTPQKCCELIRQETERAMQNLSRIEPYCLNPPYKIKIGKNICKGNDLKKSFNELLNKGNKFGDQNVNPEKIRHNKRIREWRKRNSFLA